MLSPPSMVGLVRRAADTAKTAPEGPSGAVAKPMTPEPLLF